MKLPLTALATIAALAAAATPLPPLNPAQFKRPVRVACVGDSITQGTGAEKDQSYPSQLQELLGDGWQVGNFGVGGRTLLRRGDHPYWNEEAFRKAREFQPDVVIIMLGTNDTKPPNWAQREEFEKDYTDLANTFLALPGKPRVYLCRPTPVPEPGNFGINEAGIAEEIKIIDRLASRLPVGLIDMHAALLTKPNLLPDRVHPNTVGAGEMAKTAYQVLTGAEAGAPVRANSIFRSDAVLQRDVALPVWGTAKDGTPVTVEFAGQKVSTVAKNGNWSVQLRPLALSDQPRSMFISSPKKTTTLQNILVGDVWLASGQSNMERELGLRGGQPELVGWRAEAAAADYPLLRQFYVPHNLSADPVADVNGHWSVCTPATAASFTAVGYYFARDVQKATHIPIGLIHSSWGGTPAQAWTSAEALKTLPEYRALIEATEAAKAPRKTGGDPEAEWFAKNDPGSVVGHGWEAPEFDAAGWREAGVPRTLAALDMPNFAGVVWFRKTVSLPQNGADKIAALHLGQLDDLDTTWVNGKQVGRTSDWQTNRSYNLPAGTLRAGNNTIAVRLVNIAGNGGWLSAPNELRIEFPAETGLAPIPLSGSWFYKPTADFANGAAYPLIAPAKTSQSSPAILFRSMIAPLTSFPIRGVIWYQGEADSAQAKRYRTLFPALIADWRKHWKRPDLPFLYVQIAPFKDMSPEIREAQFLTLEKTPGTAMAVTTDVGDANNIHPARKEPVGQRLALAARALAYGERIEYSGPLFQSLSVSGGKATVKFTHASGLIAKDGPLRGFTIAGADKKFVAAQAEISGNAVNIFSNEVPLPVAVRYGWANVPEVNLFNAEGLPASPFRTDVE